MSEILAKYSIHCVSSHQEGPDSIEMWKTKVLHKVCSRDAIMASLCVLQIVGNIGREPPAGRRNMPIRAGFSEDVSYVVCGSDSGAVFVWDAAPAEKGGGNKRGSLRRDKVVACESFQVGRNSEWAWFKRGSTSV